MWYSYYALRNELFQWAKGRSGVGAVPGDHRGAQIGQARAFHPDAHLPQVF
jgi:hypothetical protein